jgi:hypothetical protein
MFNPAVVSVQYSGTTRDFTELMKFDRTKRYNLIFCMQRQWCAIAYQSD